MRWTLWRCFVVRFPAAALDRAAIGGARRTRTSRPPDHHAMSVPSDTLSVESMSMANRRSGIPYRCFRASMMPVVPACGFPALRDRAAPPYGRAGILPEDAPGSSPSRLYRYHERIDRPRKSLAAYEANATRRLSLSIAGNRGSGRPSSRSDRQPWRLEDKLPDLLRGIEFVGRLGADLQDDSCPLEVRQLGRTITRWRHQMAAWHQARVSNGPTEELNNLIKRASGSRSGSGDSRTTASAPCSTPASPSGTYSRPSLRAEIRRAGSPGGARCRAASVPSAGCP
jgi:Transposase